MSDNNELYEPDLISVTDDDGNEIVFETAGAVRNGRRCVCGHYRIPR